MRKIEIGSIIGIILLSLGIILVITQPKVRPSATTKNPTKTTTETPTLTITQSPTKNMITQKPTETVTDLVIQDQSLGSGREVKSGDTISIHYTGTLENGKVFDSSRTRGQPFETKIGVGQLIKGWDMGIPGMKVGGKRKLTIPYDLAYGENGIPGTIPGKATLIFDVELMGIK